MENGMTEVSDSNTLETINHLEPKPLIYMRPSMDMAYPAELCFRGGDHKFHVYAVSQKALANLLRAGNDLMAEHINRLDRE